MPNSTETKTIAILGSGSWGTALAIHLARNQHKVHLWGKDSKQIETIRATRQNQQYLPDILLPDNLYPETDLAVTVAQADLILLAVPSHAFRTTLQSLQNHCTPLCLLSTSKGIEPATHQFLHEVAEEIFGTIPYAQLSGPSFAKEVARGLPTAITIASHQQNLAIELAALFHSKFFRVYPSNDIIGVEIGGAVKNVLAIAVGIADGLNFGANARSALITRGLAEMTHLGMALGAKAETFVGLAGLGDLVLTCTDNQSRNRRFGIALSSGKSISDAQKEIGQAVEGRQTAAEIYHLSTRLKLEMPICEQVYRVLYEGLSPAKAADNLLSRKAHF